MNGFANRCENRMKSKNNEIRQDHIPTETKRGAVLLLTVVE